MVHCFSEPCNDPILEKMKKTYYIQKLYEREGRKLIYLERLNNEKPMVAR